MEIDANKEERCAVGMYISDESAVVYVSTNVGDGGEGCGDVGGIVYG